MIPLRHVSATVAAFAVACTPPECGDKKTNVQTFDGSLLVVESGPAADRWTGIRDFTGGPCPRSELEKLQAKPDARCIYLCNDACLSFVWPDNPGTYDLSLLDARLCEGPDEEKICGDVEGTLVAAAVTYASIDLELDIPDKRADDAHPVPVMSGHARFTAHDETHESCSPPGPDIRVRGALASE